MGNAQKEIWPSLFLLGLLFKDVFDLKRQLYIYSFSYCIYHDQETGYGPNSAQSSTMILKGATSFCFQPSNFLVSPIHTVLHCKICNTKPLSPVVNYNFCPLISPGDARHSLHHVQEQSAECHSVLRVWIYVKSKDRTLPAWIWILQWHNRWSSDVHP